MTPQSTTRMEADGSGMGKSVSPSPSMSNVLAADVSALTPTSSPITAAWADVGIHAKTANTADKSFILAANVDLLGLTAARLRLRTEVVAVTSWEPISHGRRGGKHAFKLARYPPSYEPRSSASCYLSDGEDGFLDGMGTGASGKSGFASMTIGIPESAMVFKIIKPNSPET